MAEVVTREHVLTAYWDKEAEDLGEIEIFARELSRDDSLPFLLFLQGGPGSPAPRLISIDGWIAEALKNYRVILLDQRGTGRSTRIDRYGDPKLNDVRYLRRLGARYIVEDAEALRRHLNIESWAVLGQSFGGFCLTTYLSKYPESVSAGLFTGGLPATTVGVDEIYRHTFRALEARHQQLYARFPWLDQRIRQICDHLETRHETLPTGERLSARRFRTLGIMLGRKHGFEELAALCEAPFHTLGDGLRLRSDFLSAVGQHLSFDAAPLYGVIHESIYGGLSVGATNWSAQRIREEISGFEEGRDPLAEGPFYLTGEHIFPWQFEEDPALKDFAGVAHQLAEIDDWPAPYDTEALQATAVPCAAAVYTEDIYVPRELSLETAEFLPGLKIWETAKLQHNGLRTDGELVFSTLQKMLGSRA